MLSFRVLGPLVAVHQGREIRLASQHQRRLLAALLLYAGRPVPAGRLVDALWGAEPPRSAASTLQAYVSRLRGQLGRESVTRTAGGYALAPDRAVDAARFEVLADRARTAPDPAGQLRLLDEALALWRGDPYPDLPDFPPGRAEAVRLTELRAAVDRDDRVPHAVALELGIPLSGSGGAAGDRLPDRLADALSGWDLLLVLDNAEHVLGAVATVAARVLRRCPGVVPLVTSQERVAVAGEQVLPVPPLAVAGADSPAVRLFTDRASAVNPGFAPGPDELAGVVELCGQLDGLPLALEMAAARTSSYTPRELLERMDRRFSLLRGVRATEGDRHATLRAAVDWSYRLLGAAEQELFATLAGFPAGFDADAAAQVTGQDPDEVRQGLAMLVDRSLLTADLRAETARFRLLETLRGYGREVLAGRGELAATRARHAGWAVALAERADAGLRGAEEARWVARLEAALPDLRAAYQHAVGTRDPTLVDRLSTALLAYTYHRLVLEPADWAAGAVDPLGPDCPGSAYLPAALGQVHRGDVSAAERLARAAADRPAGPAVRGMAAVLLADAALYQGELAQVLPRCRDHLAGDDPYLCALAHVTAGTAEAYRGRIAAARTHAEQIRTRFQQTGAPSISGWRDYLLGEALAGDDPVAALRHLTAAGVTARQAGNRLLEGVALVAATACRARHGEPRDAPAAIAAAIGHWQRLGDWTHQWPTLRTAAILLARLGRPQTAVTIASAVAASAPPAYGQEADDLAAITASATAARGPAEVAAAEAAGVALGPGGVVRYALAAVADCLTDDHSPG